MNSRRDGMSACPGSAAWLAYFDEGAGSPDWSRHLARCPFCAGVTEELARVEAYLARTASEARDASALTAREVKAALRRFRSRNAEGRGIACCMDALNFFLVGMLGSSACAKLIDAASGQSGIDDAAWPGFIARLSKMIADLCGEGAGAIVSYIGELGQPEPA